MNKKIYKYTLEVLDRQLIEMPVGARILSLQQQGSTVCIWAIVEEGQPIDKRVFYIFGTGHTLPDFINKSDFIGTVQTGPLVWHVFDEGCEKP